SVISNWSSQASAFAKQEPGSGVSNHHSRWNPASGIGQTGRTSLADTTGLRQQIEQWITELKRGELTEESLRRGLEAIDATPARRQDLLYLQTGGTSLGSGVLGMALVRDGQYVEPPSDPKEWPYKSPLE